MTSGNWRTFYGATRCQIPRRIASEDEVQSDNQRSFSPIFKIRKMGFRCAFCRLHMRPTKGKDAENEATVYF